MRTFNEPSDSPADPLLCVDEICAVLSVSRPTLMGMWAAGEGPPVFRVGKRRKILTSTLRRWIEHRQQNALLGEAENQATANAA
jgi:excisionase family DNA binding protein